MRQSGHEPIKNTVPGTDASWPVVVGEDPGCSSSARSSLVCPRLARGNTGPVGPA